MMMWEDGTSVNKIILTQDEDYIPTGSEQEKSSRATLGSDEETRVGNIYGELKGIQSSLEGISENDDLTAVAQETYTRLKNVLGQVEDTKEGNDNYYVIHNTTVQSKLDKIQAVQVKLNNIAEKISSEKVDTPIATDTKYKKNK